MLVYDCETINSQKHVLFNVRKAVLCFRVFLLSISIKKTICIRKVQNPELERLQLLLREPCRWRREEKEASIKEIHLRVEERMRVDHNRTLLLFICFIRLYPSHLFAFYWCHKSTHPNNSEWWLLNSIDRGRYECGFVFVALLVSWKFFSIAVNCFSWKFSQLGFITRQDSIFDGKFINEANFGS